MQLQDAALTGELWFGKKGVNPHRHPRSHTHTFTFPVPLLTGLVQQERGLGGHGEVWWRLGWRAVRLVDSDSAFRATTSPLQKQETIGVNERSAHSRLLGDHTLVGKIRLFPEHLLRARISHLFLSTTL